MISPQLLKRAAVLEQIISSQHKTILIQNQPRDAIDTLDATNSTSYHDFGKEIRAIWSSIEDKFGTHGFGVYQRLVMLRLIQDFDNRAARYTYTDAILECFRFSLSRIMDSIADSKRLDYDSINDVLAKDLALCRQVLFPAGAEVVERDSGFSRSSMFKGGIRQFWTIAQVLLATGSNSGYYFYHTHLKELDEFSQEGFEKFYLRIAHMLEVNPDVRGLHTGTWFLDPALKQISPRLTYLRELPESNGAKFFYAGPDLEGGALARSETRKRLYTQGKYIPRSYCMVWPRKEMIRWANNFRI